MQSDKKKSMKRSAENRFAANRTKRIHMRTFNNDDNEQFSGDLQFDQRISNNDFKLEYPFLPM